ncbi:hypothetical protein K502DRAFT_327422 [Neoconidiobolus thromboides FSU 785]|nr:hypothetical protein K502DRAFT_327422 [Neoconidiobolus thromboides FSU 785]
MSEASVPSRHSTIDSGLTINKEVRTSTSSSTKRRVESVTKKLPRLSLNSAKYLGPGYSTSSTPYKINSRPSSCFDSTIGSSKMISPMKKNRKPRNVSSRDERRIFLSEQPLKRAKIHQSLLRSKQEDKKLELVNNSVLEILKQAEEGNKKRKKEVLAPYLQVIPESSSIEDNLNSLEGQVLSSTPPPEKKEELPLLSEKSSSEHINKKDQETDKTEKLSNRYSLPFKLKRKPSNGNKNSKARKLGYTALDIIRQTFQRKPRDPKS